MASEMNANVEPITGEPLAGNHMEDDEQHDEENGLGGRGRLAAIPETTVMEKFTLATAVVSIGTSVAAIIVAGGTMVISAGILSCICGPYCYFQQTRITDIKALKETHDALQHEVNTLHQQNQALSENVENLAGSVDRLEGVEDALNVMSNIQGESVDVFESQVKENKNILARMEGNLKAAVLQNLLSVVMGSDTDGDYKLVDKEIDELIRKMQSINGVIVNERRLRSVIMDKDGNIDSILEVMQSVVQDGGSEEEIFTFQ